MTRQANCRYCGRPILLIDTVKGKAMPVDAMPVRFVPDLNGDTYYVNPDGYLMHGCQLRPGETEETEIGYISHFATCPTNTRKRRNHA